MTPEFAAAVTGLGLVTPAGVGVADNWARVLSGRPTAATDPELAGLSVDFSCRVRDLDPTTVFGPRRARLLDRCTQLVLVAAREAVADAGLADGDCDSARVAVVIGTGAGGTATMENQQATLLRDGAGKVSSLTLLMGLSNMTAAQVAMEFGLRGPNLTVSTACASGATAIGTARDLLRTGAADVVVAGGTDAAITRLFVSAFTRMKALSTRSRDPLGASRPFDVSRDGFVIGEGAGVVVLESEEHARRRGARIHASVIGFGASCDAHHVAAPDPTGGGAELAVRTALAGAGITGRDVGYVNAHGTSTPLNDVAEADVILRTVGDHVLVSSTKGVTGHTLGGAGAIEAVYSILALEGQQVPPTANLGTPDPAVGVDLVRHVPRPSGSRVAMSNSFGFGGHNAVLVMAAN